MVDIKNLFTLRLPDNQTKDSNQISTDLLNYDSIADFAHEREKIRNILDDNFETKLKIDYSNFKNHVWLDSALQKFTNIKNKILTQYPYNGNQQDKYAFNISGTDYQKYILEQWPRSVGYVQFNGIDQYITASDYNNTLLLGTSSLYVSAWINPVINLVGGYTRYKILEVFSASTTLPTYHLEGYEFILTDNTCNIVQFNLLSGTTTKTVSGTVNENEWSNIAAIYDRPGKLLSLYVNGTLQDTESCDIGPIEHTPTTVRVGTGSWATDMLYSGSLAHLRICHTASALYHQRNYMQSIDSEDFIKLYYTFNEGIVGTSSIDSIVADYSKSGIHGIANGYSDTFRISGSSMPIDSGNPILYSFHSGVVAFTSSIENSASFYDKSNKSYIERLVASDVLQHDELGENLLRPFLLGMASFFDELKLYIDQIDNLRVTNYDNSDEVPDQFLPYLKRYFGWKISDHFSDANPLEYLLGQGVTSTGSLTTSLPEVRNQFWRRILNNLIYFYKSKGKKSSIDGLMNSLGINPNIYKIREFGYSPSTTIQSNRYYKEKDIHMLGFGTGSLTNTGSFVKVPNVFTTPKTQYTVEIFGQLPYVSASYNSSVVDTIGSLWQFVDPEQVTGSFSLLWNTVALGSITGSLILTGSDGQSLTLNNLSIFDGDFVSIAAGLGSNQKPFINVRTVDNDSVDFSSSIVGSTVFSGVFTGSKYDFIIGANSGSNYHHYGTHGYYGEVRVWNSQLSSSELKDHALNPESIGTEDPLNTSQLIGHWPLNDNIVADANGKIYKFNDYSRNNLWGTGSIFVASKNPFKKQLIGYNILSPSFDLGATEQKVRVRNVNKLTTKDISKDSNEVSLEFNLVSALNEDISKIFSSFDVLNNAIGNPVNKYRDEYSDLEAYRRIYFERLGDSINFTNFFKAFKWFDRKLSDSIKQLLPAKTIFIGGEQVVESHMLERPKYKYRYSIFKTPKDVGIGDLDDTMIAMSGTKEQIAYENKSMKGSYTAGKQEENKIKILNIENKDTACEIDGEINKLYTKSKSYDGNGQERIDRNNNNFVRTQYSGDDNNDIFDKGNGINFKNEYAKKELAGWENKNYPNAYHSGVFMNSKNEPFINYDLNGTMESNYYNSEYRKYVNVAILYGSGSVTPVDADTEILFFSGTGISIYTNMPYAPNATFLFTGTFYIKDKYDNYILLPDSEIDKIFFYRSDGTPNRKNIKLSFDIIRTNWLLQPSLEFNIGSNLLYKNYKISNITPYPAVGDYCATKRCEAVVDIDGENLKFGERFFLSATVDSDFTEVIFNKLKLEFFEPVSEYGMKYLNNIDNQNIEFRYINDSILRNSLLKNNILLKDNINEFPHYDGMFQMKNIVLGTQDSGRLGKTDDSIIQVNHVGSTVHIMFPKKDSEDLVIGNSDASEGSKPGKLTTDWTYGDWYDVSEFDHLSLYSYAYKDSVGTADSILIKVQRKPLINIGGVTNTAIEYETSGSFVEEIHKDLIIRRDIDYSDLSIKEDGWPSDIPLVNTKQIRIAAKQKVGQTEDKNKSLIVYGRLIKSDKET